MFNNEEERGRVPSVNISEVSAPAIDPDFLGSPDEDLNPMDSTIENEEEGEISPTKGKRHREEPEHNWILNEIENIPVSHAELALITKEMFKGLHQQPRNRCERRDLVQMFKLLRSASKRLMPHQIDLTRTFKGQGLYGSWEAFVKRVNEGSLETHIQKLYSDKERFSLSEIRKVIHIECVKEKADCVVVLKEGICRLCEEEGAPPPRANSIFSRKRTSSSFLEDCIHQYLTTVNRTQKRQKVSLERDYVPRGTQLATEGSKNRNFDTDGIKKRNFDTVGIKKRNFDTGSIKRSNYDTFSIKRVPNDTNGNTTIGVSKGNEVFSRTPFATSVESIIRAETHTHGGYQEHPPQECDVDSKSPVQVGTPPNEHDTVVTNDETGTFYPYVADATSRAYRQRQAAPEARLEAYDRRSPRQPSAHRHGNQSREEDRGGHQRSEGYYYPDVPFERRESRSSRRDYYRESRGSHYDSATLLQQVLHLVGRIERCRDRSDDDRRETRKSLDLVRDSLGSLSTRVVVVEKQLYCLNDQKRDLEKRVQGLRQENLSLKKKLETVLADVSQMKDLLRSRGDLQHKDD